jgi:ATP-binding cassette subfamily F protein uup
VRRLEALRAERTARRERLGNVRLALEAGERSGKRVAELKDVTKRFGDRTIVRDLTLNVMRGDRLALIGPNGAGKTTLLKLILGQMAPDTGTVRLGTNLEIAYFDQMRAVLDESQTLAETISPGSEWIESAGQRRHVLSYLGDFLFPPQRAQAPVSTLSGGERNRLLLARLFAKPTNLLVLDEPTNDLDIESLELLEETLQAYPGTLLLVSHDRAFLDNIATQSLVAEGDGVWREYAGGYSDWLVQRPAPVEAAPQKAAAQVARVDSRRERSAKPGLTFKEQRELDALPHEIETLEAEQHALTERMCAPGYHQQAPEALRTDRQRAESIEHALAEKFERWAALDAKAAAKPSR